MEKYDELIINCKRKINKWEQEFQKDKGKPPTKEDFKEAPITVTDAYKLYYKLKKKILEGNKSDQPTPESPAQRHPVEDVTNNCQLTPIFPQVSLLNTSQEKVENCKLKSTNENKSSGEVAWGDHLNKPKFCPEAPQAVVSQSPRFNYSKLSEKLMKGAKIKIRSSLTRKPSLNLSLNSPQPCSNGIKSEDRKSENSLSTPIDEPSPSKSDMEETDTIFNGFKPKIVQNIPSIKQPYNLHGIASRTSKISKRNVDIQWLDECLAAGNASLKPSANYDQDIIYSSDDEQLKKSELPNSKKKLPLPESSPSQESSPPPAIGVKRKSEDVLIGCKKPRMEPSTDVVQDDFLAEGTPVMEKRPVTEYEGMEEVKVKESSANAVKRERLASKMASGTANENFVRINLKKKVFVRGRKTQTGSSYKRQQWKARAQGASSAAFKGGKFRPELLPCKRCGELGHWAKQCRKEVLMPLEHSQAMDDDMEFPTLEEAMEKADESAKSNRKKIQQVDAEDNEDLQLVEVKSVAVVEPFCDPNETVVPPSVFKILKKFGHESFRPGQEAAIMRILSGRSTLVVQSTGAGKSLCYQLPAVLYAERSPSITIVVSPLVSLMEDQVSNLPSFVKAVCLHANQSAGVREKTVEQLKSGKVHILLISPESVVSSGPFGLTCLLRQMPPVAFVCIDEAHCVSQWSHNFRPSYLRICKILRQKMNIQTILGLTATAPRSTLKSIADHLGVDGGEDGVIRGVLLPLNLQLTVSRDADRDAALVELLQGGRFENFNSIIIYCIRREECERIATLLRTYLKDPVKDMNSKSKSNRRGISWSAESYHAGLSAARRASIQKQFMASKLRIVVATVAFGMGINKSDIRAIIHYNAPKNFENYVQEMGRAGRDGLPAHCHVFLNSEGKDLQELRRFIYANSLDRHVLRKLLRKIFPPETCKCPPESCTGHEVAIPIDAIVQELDMPEENIATLICHLEAHPAHWIIEVGTKVYATCTVRCYGGLYQLKTAAQQCPALGAALAMQKQDASSAVRTFSVVDVARHIGWDSGAVKRQLKDLEWDTSGVALGGKARRSGVLVEFTDLAFHLRVRGNLTESEQDAALEFLHQRCVNRERTELQQLQRIHQALLSVSHANSSQCCDQVDATKSEKLRSFIHDYFEETAAPVVVDTPTLCPEESQVRSDIRNLVLNYRDQTFTARSIARIFHGIASPCFPAEVWGKARKHWRSHLNQDFNLLCRMAVQELLALK